MENKEKNIVVPLPDGKSCAELPSTQSSIPMQAVQSHFINITEMMAKSIQIGQTVTNTLGPALENFANTISKAYDFSATVKPMLAALQQFSTYLSEAVANIKIPMLSEDRKQELLENHKQWGQYGWTWLPNAPFNFFNTLPLDYNDANKKVESLCSAKVVEDLFNKLRQQNLNKADLESAIFCYHNRQYKACVLILFGLIDAKLIRRQPIRENRRKVGATAVKKLKGQFEEEKDEQAFYRILYFANLITCLETFFADGNNFKDEPLTINRNFVDHGMNRRNVRKRDCIQLFLALHNLLYFL